MVVNIDFNAYEFYGSANRDGTPYLGQGAHSDPGNDHWNVLTIENKSASDLLASDGSTVTSVSVVTTGGNGFVDTGITNFLLSDYFYSSTSTTISGLDPNTSYTVYVYAVGDTPGQGSTVTIGTDVQSTTGDNVNNFVLGGNYLIFTSNSDNNGDLVIDSSEKINGIQILGVAAPPPPPTSLTVNIEINAYESNGSANRIGTPYTGQGAYADPGNDYWNPLTIENRVATGLLASDGTTATAINAVITGGDGFVDTVITNDLLSDYFYGGTRTTIYGLEPDTDYTLYVYAVGDQPGQGSSITVGFGRDPYENEDGDINVNEDENDFEFESQNYPKVNLGTQSTTGENVNDFVLDGNYIVFNITSSPIGRLVINSTEKINGFQIVGVAPLASKPFVHPGLSHKLSDLQRMKAQVEAKEDPWYSTYLRMSALPSSSYDYVVRGIEVVDPVLGNVLYRDSPRTNKAPFEADSRAAYHNALMWAITGDTRHADKAVECLMAWTDLTYVQHYGTASLTSNLIYLMLEAAEIMKSTYPGWSATDIQAFKDMLVYPGYSNTTVPSDLTTQGTWYWRAYMFDKNRAGNQELSGIRTTTALGVFLDNQIMYERGLRYVRGLTSRPDDLPYGAGPSTNNGTPLTSTIYKDTFSNIESTDVPDSGFNGTLTNFLWENGQCEESSRDQGHTFFGIGELASIGEIAWNQGFDFYAAVDSRLLLGLEFTLKYNLSYHQSYPDQTTPWEPTVASGEYFERHDATARSFNKAINPFLDSDTTRLTRGQFFNTHTWEMPTAHYVGRGIMTTDEAKWTERTRDYIIEATGRYEEASNGQDYVGWGGLSFRRPVECHGDPISGFLAGLPEYHLPNVPGTIEAENYDYFTTSGAGHTYHDLTPGNNGGEYRPGDEVDIITCSEGGYALTHLEDGEWLSYTINAQFDDRYILQIRYASDAQSQIRFAFEGTDVTGDVILPATGSRTTWETYTVARNIRLRQGAQSMRIYVTGASDTFDLNSITLTQETQALPSPTTIHIEAESYLSQNGTNTESTSDTGGGLNVGNIDTGDWLHYGSYDLGEHSSIRLRLARPSGRPEGKVEIRLDSPTGPLVGSIHLQETGSWQIWQTFETNLDPVIGSRSLYLVFRAYGLTPSSSALCNLNWLELDMEPDPVAPIPSNFVTAPATASEVNLSWNFQDDVSEYHIRRSTLSGGPYETFVVGPDETAYTDTGLNAGTQYFYTIRAILTGTESGDATESSVVPSNPINPETVFISSMQILEDEESEILQIVFPNSGLGHFHHVESMDTLLPSWTEASEVKAGTGGDLVFEIPLFPGQSLGLYRIVVERQ